MHGFDRISEQGGEAQRLLDALLIVRANKPSFDGYMVELVASPPFDVDPGASARFEMGADTEDELHDMFASAVIAMYDPPGDASVDISLTGWLASPGFRLQATYDEAADRVTLAFDDGSQLISTGSFRPGTETDRWDAAVANGSAQARLEAIVTLASASNLVERLGDEDGRLAAAVLELLGASVTATRPDRGLVRSSLMWLGRKVDLFVDEAAKTGGKVAGAGVAAGVGIAVAGRFPELADRIKQLLEVTGV